MAVLSDRSIKKEIESGNIVLHDPDRDTSHLIQNCSVDFTLGPYYFRSNKKVTRVNHWNKEQSCSYWGNTVNSDGSISYNYQTALAVKTETEAREIGIPIGQQYILLGPGETILGHSQEFIGAKRNITTMMKGRSSMGRSNYTVCRDAGWGDIGYINRWTLEITNESQIQSILRVGQRIGQIVFLKTEESDTVYKGKYQHTNNLQELVSAWHPSALCPKMWEDCTDE